MEVTVVNRTPERAERLARDLGARLGSDADPYDLLVNATSVGMHPAADATPIEALRLREGGTVFDVVYRPLATRLIEQARARGCRTVDGLGMLIHQAIEQLAIWSGRHADPIPLRRAAEAALLDP